MARLTLLLILALLSLTGLGCGTAVSGGTAAALTAFDLEAMTRQMADSITADPEVQAAMRQAGPLRVVVLPVENRMRGEVLPIGQARAFTARVRMLLARERPDAFVWIMNRDDFYALRGRELEIGVADLGPAPDAVNPQFALTATFTSLVDVDRARRTAYYVCAFELVDLGDRSLIWTDSYQVRRTAVRGFLD